LNAGAVVSDQELVSRSEKPRKVEPYRSGLRGDAEALIAWEELGLDDAAGLLKETLEEKEAAEAPTEIAKTAAGSISRDRNGSAKVSAQSSWR
jgi:hypothetical protein